VATRDRSQGHPLWTIPICHRNPLVSHATTASNPSAGATLGLFYGRRRRHAALPTSLAFDSWSDVIDALLGLGTAAPDAMPVIIDEFPNLVAQAPALPSVIQIALSPRSHVSLHMRTRLILCGSALTVMRDLLGGGTPLRGRATLELMLQPFWYRRAGRISING
jgi:hypothetical protein